LACPAAIEKHDAEIRVRHGKFAIFRHCQLIPSDGLWQISSDAKPIFIQVTEVIFSAGLPILRRQFCKNWKSLTVPLTFKGLIPLIKFGRTTDQTDA
jgi:hypothetical protein